MKNILSLLATASVLAFAVNAHATAVFKIGGNNSQGTAQNLDNAFSLDFSADIGNSSGANTSTSIAHATVTGPSGQAIGTPGALDWYSFTAAAGQTIILDIDYGMYDFDANLHLWLGGSNLAQNDDYWTGAGAGGSLHGYDSFIQYTTSVSGLYSVAVGRCCWDIPFGNGNDYQLQVSVSNHSLSSVPDAAATLSLFGLALIGLVGFRSKFGSK